MTEMEKAAATLRSSLCECDSHVARLERGFALLSEFFPLKALTLEECSDEQSEHIDQFIYRFSKLQDSMVTRLLPALHVCLEGTQQPLPFIDVLSKMEKLDVIPSAEEWQYFRNLRNNIAHDYPESSEQTVLTLNMLFKDYPRMKHMYQQTRAYALQHL